MNAINSNSTEYMAIQYGRSDSLAAGDEGFGDFYTKYQEELNNIGKRPDLLIFRKSDISSEKLDLDDDNFINKAVAAIEVRSSSFLAGKYARFMEERATYAIKECSSIRNKLISGQLSCLLKSKAPELFKLLEGATDDTFREIDFRARSWSSTNDLKTLSDLLKRLKEKIKILHKRDYLSITPKLEDLALVNRWIQQFNVRHYYLQVFLIKHI